MDSLEQKLDEIEVLLKAIGDLGNQLNFKAPKASIKQAGDVGRPRGPGIPRQALAAPKMPSAVPSSKKNPVKVAQHTPSPIKDVVDSKVAQAKEGLAFNPGGQWRLKKADEAPKQHFGWVSPSGQVHQDFMENYAFNTHDPHNYVSPHDVMAMKLFPDAPPGYASQMAIEKGWMKWNSGQPGHVVGSEDAVHPDSTQMAGLKLHLHKNPEARASMGNRITAWDNKGWGKPNHTMHMDEFLAVPKAPPEE